MNANKEVAQTHYYACTGYNWAVAPTREQAIKKIAADCGSALLKRHKAKGGLYFWSCEVMAPITEHYKILEYTPQIAWREGVEGKIMNLSKFLYSPGSNHASESQS